LEEQSVSSVLAVCERTYLLIAATILLWRRSLCQVSTPVVADVLRILYKPVDNRRTAVEEEFRNHKAVEEKVELGSRSPVVEAVCGNASVVSGIHKTGRAHTDTAVEAAGIHTHCLEVVVGRNLHLDRRCTAARDRKTCLVKAVRLTWVVGERRRPKWAA
jgi:hypothetical protein